MSFTLDAHDTGEHRAIVLPTDWAMARNITEPVRLDDIASHAARYLIGGRPDSGWIDWDGDAPWAAAVDTATRPGLDRGPSGMV